MRTILILVFIFISLMGCTNLGGTPFTYFVDEEVEKINFRNGAGVTYSTSDKELIHRFISTMESTTYTKASNPNLTGSSRVTFYGENDKEIVTLTFVGDYFYKAQDTVYYKTLPKELKSVYEEFLVEENRVSQ